MEGILLVDKPKGWTSFDVVNYVRKIVAQSENKKPKHVKVGHSGTLDPAATGLLVLCIGKYTKKMPDLIKHDKSYVVELTLGKTSTTGDSEGVITTNEEGLKMKVPENAQVTEALKSFVGEIQQVPPAFSAIKIQGKRAYQLAREGKEVKLAPRLVTIYKIQNVKYEWPKLNFTTKVSSGTYIRALAADIGENLGTGAYMSALNRSEVGEFSLVDALKVEELSDATIKSSLAK